MLPHSDATIAQHKPIRNTFGLYDPSTKQKYADILGSHLQLRRLLLEEWLENGYILEHKDRHKRYKILLDFATQRQLLRDGIIDVLISFQRRTTGNYAVCRLWDASKTKKQFITDDKEELQYHV